MKCSWVSGCHMDRTDESGEFCYYHHKLVAGEVSPAPSKRPDLAEDLARSGADPTVYEGVDARDKPVAKFRESYGGLMPQGSTRH